MKRLLIFFGILVFITTLFITAHAFAAMPKPTQERTVILASSETVNGNYYNGGSNVTISGKVNGDVYVAGGNVIIDGTVNGDVLVAGGTIVVRGIVTQNVRALGGNIDISGTVGRNTSAVGGSVMVSEGAKLHGSIVGVGGNVIVMASVPKGIDAAAGQLTIGNIVGGPVQAAVGQLTLNPKASIAGSLTYWSDHEADVQGGARITGAVHHYSSPGPTNQKNAEGAIKTAVIVSKIINFLTAATVGLLLVFLLPNFMKNASETVFRNPLRTFWWGILITILVPFLSLIFLITIIGIPLGVICFVLYLVAAYLGKFLVIYAFGVWIAGLTKTKMHPAWAYILGLLLYEIIKFIPLIGFLVSAAVFFMGIGILVLEKRYLYMTLRKEKYL